MSIAIVVLESLSIPFIYEGEEPRQDLWSGEWGSPDIAVHVKVPEGLDPQCLMALREGDKVTLVEDPDKVQAKTAAAWSSVRAQQKQKLYESDWTCSVTDYGVPDKELWIAYRQALRDVTKQGDPFNIEWPVTPASA
jgi:hypothetical protein